MNRSCQIREIFTELRYVLGDSVSARDALEAAASLVDLFTAKEEVNGSQYELKEGPLPFYEWAVDVAMADGGWRVMRYEFEQARTIEEPAEWNKITDSAFDYF